MCSWQQRSRPHTLRSLSTSTHRSDSAPPAAPSPPHLDKVLVLRVPVQQDAAAHGGVGVLDVPLDQGAQVHQVLWRGRGEGDRCRVGVGVGAAAHVLPVQAGLDSDERRAADRMRSRAESSSPLHQLQHYTIQSSPALPHLPALHREQVLGHIHVAQRRKAALRVVHKRHTAAHARAKVLAGAAQNDSGAACRVRW